MSISTNAWKRACCEKKNCSKKFYGRCFTKLMPLIKKNAEDLLFPHLPNGKIDLINDFGRTFAVYVTMDMIGLDKKDHKKIGEWHSGVADFITSINQPPEAKTFSLVQ